MQIPTELPSWPVNTGPIDWTFMAQFIIGAVIVLFVLNCVFDGNGHVCTEHPDSLIPMGSGDLFQCDVCKKIYKRIKTEVVTVNWERQYKLEDDLRLLDSLEEARRIRDAGASNE